LEVLHFVKKIRELLVCFWDGNPDIVCLLGDEGPNVAVEVVEAVKGS